MEMEKKEGDEIMWEEGKMKVRLLLIEYKKQDKIDKNKEE